MIEQKEAELRMSAIKLEPADLSAWKSRFNSFDDAVVRRWQITFNDGTLGVEVDIETKDFASKGSGWSLVTLKIAGGDSLQFLRSEKSQYNVLSNGLHILNEAGVYGLEFGDFADAPANISELKRSPCHIIAREIFWNAQEVS